MIFLFVFAIIAFAIFFNRASQVGEDRRAFWGFSGVAAVIGPSIIIGLLFGIIESFFEYLPEWARLLRSIVGVVCLISGVVLGKWVLDRFLPLPAHLVEAQDSSEIPEDD